jgi:hypothetical protein
MHLIIAIDRNRFVGEDRRAVFGQPVDRLGTLLDFGARRTDGLAHLGGDDCSQRFRAIAQRRCEPAVGGNPFRHRRVAPQLKRGRVCAERSLHCIRRLIGIGGDEVIGRWVTRDRAGGINQRGIIGGLQRHGNSFEMRRASRSGRFR